VSLDNDSLNRETSVQGLFNVTLTFVYDNAGNRTAVQDSFGGYLTSTYDGDNRLTFRSYTGQGTSLSYDQQYDAAGNVTKVDRYSNAGGTTKVGESDYTYDSAGRVTSINHKNGSGTSLAQYTYTYDTGSRLTLQTYNGTNTSYGYDGTSQLTNDGGTGYSYDANGNRNMAGWTTGADNQLTNDGTYTYTYDNEGNLIEKSKGTGQETWYYGYDQKNHLTSVRETTDGTTNELTVTYSYDVFGNMGQQLKWTNTTGLATLHEVYDGSEVYMDLNGSNNLQTTYIRGDQPNQLVARVASSTANWYLTDREGSVRDITNASGSVIDAIAYDAFGKVLSQTATTVSGYYGFQGMRMDQDLGGYLDGWRFLNWSTGRYSQQDQSGLAPDSNPYRFVHNDVTNATDPSGLEELQEQKKGREQLGELKMPVTEDLGKNAFGSWSVTYEPIKFTGDAADVLRALSASVTFTPDKTAVNATAISFVQIARLGKVESDEKNDPITKIRLKTPQIEARSIEGGWHVDRLKGSRYGWYGLTNENKINSDYEKTGSTAPVLKPATLIDKPQLAFDPNMQLVPARFEAVAAAIARTGVDAGKVYGFVHWGFFVDSKGRVLPDKPRLLKNSDPLVKSWQDSVAKWNDQAAGNTKVNDKVIKNDAAQEALPKFTIPKEKE
jgi:RHS repeat-associated protein